MDLYRVVLLLQQSHSFRKYIFNDNCNIYTRNLPQTTDTEKKTILYSQKYQVLDSLHYKYQENIIAENKKESNEKKNKLLCILLLSI